MRKPQAFSLTKQKLLEAAQKLMLARGYPVTTLDDICAAARVTKGSFFHYFKSKEDLGKAVLEHFMVEHFQAMQSAAFIKKRDPLARVYGYVDFAIGMSKDPAIIHGCLLGSFAQDLSDTHPRIRLQCAHYFDQWAAALKRELDAAKAEYAPRAAIDTQSLAEHFIAVVEGALILVKVKQDAKILEKQLRHFKRYLQSLLEGHVSKSAKHGVNGKTRRIKS